MTGLFVTGTDTDVGKTVITAGLLRALRLAGCSARAIKPVQTGVDADTHPYNDTQCYTEALTALPKFPELHSLAPACGFRFRLAASPHLAARQEGQRLTVSDICGRLRDFPAPFALLEGAGGALVPLNESETMLDLMAALGLPVLLVARNGLGAINHVLLTVQALSQRGLRLAGLVVTRTAPLPENDDERLVLADNLACWRAQPGIPAVWEVPFMPDLGNAAAALENRLKVWDAVAHCLAPLAKQLVHNPQDATTETLTDRDRRVLWHPYTSAVNPLPVYEAASTSGTRITLADGRQVVDGMASWWCAVHGYGHPRLVQAVQEQVGRMSHVMFGGLTHKPAVRLAERLLEWLPEGLSRVFWSDSGSVSVEVALKMALQFQRSQGRDRTRILAPRGGYHGDTIGAMAVCDPENGMHSLFTGLVNEHLFVPRPSCRFDAQYDPASTQELEAAFTEHGSELAAVILEPIVQGAGGMWFYHPEYLRCVSALCQQYDVLLIADEVATGFGRTGKGFACEWAGITPDILCCGKALTGGMLSLAGTACTERVARGICANGHVFMHGPTFMGNALACRVAEASLELLRDNNWPEQVAALESGLRLGLAPCAAHPDVVDVRVLGGIGVVECRNPVNIAELQRFFVKQGVWIRPFNRLIYLMPPYVTTSADLRRLTEVILMALEHGVHRV